MPAITWIIGNSRRPGTLGAATSVSGKFLRRRARATRDNEDWILSTDNGVRTISTGEFFTHIANGDFLPATVEVLPDIAPNLFDRAVRDAEGALTCLYTARAKFTEVAAAGEGGVPIFEYAMASHELDMTLQMSVVSVILSIATVEAQLNKWAVVLGGWAENEDRLSVGEKVKTLAARFSVSIDLGRAPYQRLSEAVSRRNEYVHSSPIPRPMSLTGRNVTVPGTSIAMEAREACLGTRQALIALAKTLGQPLPRYLSACPNSDPPTEESWSGAVVLDGVREDPDFPKRNL